MREFLAGLSLRAQWVSSAALTAGVTGLVSLLALSPGGEASGAISPSRIAIVVAGAALSVWFVFVASRRILGPFSQLRTDLDRIGTDPSSTRDLVAAALPNREWRETAASVARLAERIGVVQREHESAQAVLAERTQTVDRLLDFSQTIAGAGRPEQVYSTLTHVLRTELALTSLVVLAHDAESSPPVQVKACYPVGIAEQSVAAASAPVSPMSVGELDVSLCPAFRQNQPRAFRPDGSTVRCAIESCVPFGSAQPAYCIPFHLGRSLRLVAHLLLPTGETWTDQRRHLAHAYVNTAQSALASLHLLAEAEKQSMTDSLTGLYNRRSMEQLLEREVALAERHGRPLSVVMIDIDRFKQVNDGHGHAAGDHLLKTFADCVRITLRKTDLAFRYGGDEFIVALPQTPVAQAEQVVHKLRQAFAAVDFSSAIAHLDAQPTLSVGVAERSAAHNLLTLSSLMGAADHALYEAKSGTRNCVKIYQPPKAA